MKKYKLALQAEKDLLDIFLYGIEHWGVQQAEKYADEMHHCFNTLADNPRLGQIRKDLKNNPCSFVKGAHVIFYRFNKNHIEISTVVHQSKDVQF